MKKYYYLMVFFFLATLAEAQIINFPGALFKAKLLSASISIYNALGQLVQVIPNAKDIQTIDVARLRPGNYYLKINSDKGTSNTRFIKK